MHGRCCRAAASSVHYTTSCKHSLVFLRMGEIIAWNMLRSLKLLIKLLLLHLFGSLYYCTQFCYRFLSILILLAHLCISFRIFLPIIVLTSSRADITSILRAINFSFFGNRGNRKNHCSFWKRKAFKIGTQLPPPFIKACYFELQGHNFIDAGSKNVRNVDKYLSKSTACYPSTHWP
jgi:hypothetical protein